MGSTPAAPAVEELLSAEAVLESLPEEVFVPVEDPVDVVPDPVDVVVAVPFESVPVLTAVTPEVDPVSVAVAEPEPVALLASEMLVTLAHWLLNEASRLDCSPAMLDCTAWNSDCASAPVAVAVFWYEAIWLLMETTSLA